ncbi:hypothetical protein AURDEDRAFT_161336 [Auricularia subglabra TFB-10046 SS5]|nr:hypothetical protein AURDEDRAFT_161336 [Auricularia subglabra TFB-10046 SS5]
MDPAGVRSVYRLALRAISASVLHSSRSVHHLRRLYKPTFRAGLVVASKLQNSKLQPEERVELEWWLKTWNSRVDGTLKLLIYSAKARGVPDLVTRNLSHLFHSYYAMRNHQTLRTAGEWNPHLTHYDVRPLSQKVQRKQAMESEIESKGWDGLTQAIRMAESTAGLSLGRLEYDLHIRRYKGQKFRR